MKVRRPSPAALALFDRFVAENPALRGDLLEEFHAGRSQAWLWRQVAAALLHQPRLPSMGYENFEMVVPGVALVLLASFEVVLVTNLLNRLLFGPPIEPINAYIHMMNGMMKEHPASPGAASLSDGVQFWVVRPLLAFAAAALLGRVIAPWHRQHRGLALCAFVGVLMPCVVFNLQAPIEVQFVATTFFIAGLLGGGRTGVFRWGSAWRHESQS